MVDSRDLKIASAVAVAVLIGSVIYLDRAQTDTSTQASASFVQDGKEIGKVSLEVADNDSARRKGLMFRKNLEKDQGMLFVFEDEAARSFWMKNTYIPLDIIFVDSNMSIVNIEEAYPQPNVSDRNLEIYRSEAPAKYVIELNQGYSENISLEKGDKVKIRRIK